MKKKVIILIVLVVMILAGFIVFNVVKSNKVTANRIKLIKENYGELVENVNEYNNVRKEYISLSSEFILESYLDKHEEYISLLTNYNEVIKKIDFDVKKIDDVCNVIYSDDEVNNICANYKVIYEKIINLYVKDLTNYNDNLVKYNEYKNDNLDMFEMIHSEYIDYNNDNLYEGRDKNEEDKSCKEASC